MDAFAPTRSDITARNDRGCCRRWGSRGVGWGQTRRRLAGRNAPHLKSTSIVPACVVFLVLILGLSMFVSLCWLFWLSVHLACLSIICLPLSCLCGRGPCFFILLSFSCLLVLFCPKLKFDNGGPRTEERLGPSTGPRPVEP